MNRSRIDRVLASAVLAVVIVPAGGAWSQQAATAPAQPPIAADLSISNTMAATPGAVDLNVEIKPNVKPVHRHPKGLSSDELCGMVNTQRIDMGRGIATASPPACRRKGITVRDATGGTGQLWQPNGGRP